MAGILPLPRDPATDRSNAQNWQDMGQGQPVPLGRSRRLTAQVDSRTRRPVRWRNTPVRVQARNLSQAAPVRLAPGTIRRNVVFPTRGHGGRGLFSWTANRSEPNPGRPFQVTNPARYLVSSLHLGLAAPLKWPILGAKPPVPEGPQGQRLRRMAGPSTGWPVVAPTVPSFGSRVPLLRPRGLVSNQ